MSDYFERVERQIVRRIEAGAAPRRAWAIPAMGHIGLVAAVLVVVVVASVSLLLRTGGGGSPSPAGHGSVEVTLTTASAHPPAQVLDGALRILRQRLHVVFPDVEVTRDGRRIAVDVRDAPAGTRSEILALVVPGRLALYDWEGDVLAPNGKTVASQLRAGNPKAVEISQGNGIVAPGGPAAGALPLAQALAVVRKTGHGGRFALLRASDRDPLRPIRSVNPSAPYYVLHGVPALTGADLAKPRASTDPNTALPIVTFDFTAPGKRAFRALTASIARRGATVSGLGQTLNQHFAIALDDALITVPSIDYRQYPDGISGSDGADIAENLTSRSARELAILLRYGPLPADFRATG